MELKCAFQQYDWGKKGASSEVASLLKNVEPSFTIEDDKPYAELWMGTHINGPSVLKHNGQQLSDWIKSHPEALGKKVQNKFGLQLPFLFKILSVNKALSIQAHPSKAHAEQLHQKHPELYKDPNHKPELAIAITKFEALCGFQPTADIKKFLRNLPELQEVIGQENISHFLQSEGEEAEKCLKKCFTALMKRENHIIENSLSKLIKRIDGLDEKSRTELNGSLIKSLYEQYPGDVGCFSAYLLNYLCLNPGEAIFLGPNEPHAYLFGDCVECMACSDNVVRAGLTPKYKDVDTLCNMLDYKGAPAKEKCFLPITEDKYSLLYKPPVPDFAVAKIEIPPNVVDYDLHKRESASIIIVIAGEVDTSLIPMRKGSVIFLPENYALKIKKCCTKEGAFMYQAFCNL